MTPQRRGEAGRRGKEIRSDVWASVELLGSGGVELDMRSRVEPYFGDAIRTQVTSLLEGLGIEHARIEIEDSGALPFVIAGRIEAAARQAGLDPGCGGLPERTAQDTPGTSRSALRRSRLYLPGNEPKYFLNAGLYSPDGVILDLEDSVHAEGKLSARLLVRNALRVVDFKGAERMVRINQLPLGLEDLEAVVPEHPDLILVPKVETADQVREVEQAIDRQIGDSKRSLWLMPIIENALGVENAFDIAAASPRIAALTIGLEDYAADMGVPRSADGRESLYARLPTGQRRQGRRDPGHRLGLRTGR